MGRGRKNKMFSPGGFTTAEVIAVVAILAIIAAIAIPSAMAFVGYGKQQNRMNIARTIYLAAQGELTNRKAAKNLKATLTGLYYEINGGVYEERPTLFEDRNNVALQLGSNFPSADAGNEAYVRYISKPYGYTPGGGGELDDFYSLLNGIIIDKNILNGAVLMEYNIETGVVMSIFYSDEPGVTLGYSGDGTDSVLGGRGMSGYTFASERSQGYYGTGSTGIVEPVVLADIVNLYDGIDVPLTVNGERKENVLYAELLLAKNLAADGSELAMPPYILSLTDTDIECSVDFEFEGLSDFNFSLSDDGLVYLEDSSPVLIQNGINVGAYYKRYIWIIDYIDGDLLADPQNHTIGNKTEPANVRAEVLRGGGRNATSLQTVNTHFYGVLPGRGNEIRSARHLNNIRYVPDGTFSQTVHIDMQTNGNEITNFVPIADFAGVYYAMNSTSTQYRIANLTIDTTESVTPFDNTGLFAKVSGTVTGISLYKAVINAQSGNVGAIAGTLGGTISHSSSYGNVSADVGASVGGLVGTIEQTGRLDQSFNAGFYNAQTNPDTKDGFGAVTVLGGSGGGLAGSNHGIIRYSFNNARVNIDSMEYSTADSLSHTPQFAAAKESVSLGGIAGVNAGVINGCYATNYIPTGTGCGIAGIDTGMLKDCYFIANGGSGSGAVTKDVLMNLPAGLSAAFNRGSAYVPGNNLYVSYPYPVLKNNNPFGEILSWGWEDILLYETGDIELLYYERYTDGSFGYSHGTSGSLASASSGKLAANDGYLLDFGYMQKLELRIGGNSYILADSNADVNNPNWTWTQNVTGRMLVNVPVAYSYTEDGETSSRYRLFLENQTLESCAQGGNMISLTVVALENEENPFVFYFNPLFANTVRTYADGISVYTVRSPRHLDNIDRVPASDFAQYLNMDFSVYRKSLNQITNSAAMGSITLNNGSGLRFDGEAVVTGVFTGSYDGRDLFAQKVTAKFGLFDTIGDGGCVGDLTLRESSITGHWAGDTGIGGIARINDGTISGCSVLSEAVAEEAIVSGDYHVYIGGVAGINNGLITDCLVESADIDGSLHVGGIAGVNNSGASITDSIVLSSSIIGNWGGGNTDIGGIAGRNYGTISGCTARDLVTEGQNHVGGITGINNALLTDCTVQNAHLRGLSDIGGIAGENAGTLRDCTVNILNIDGQNRIGGISGQNTDTILRCTVTSAEITGNNGGSMSIGGIAGENRSGASVGTAAVLYSEVHSQGAKAGGVAGINGGTISDVFFLSVNDLSNLPITTADWDVGGGIAGQNTGTITKALYLAPAPQWVDNNSNTITICPIVGIKDSGGDAGAIDDCYYLAGYRYSLNNGVSWIAESYNRVKGESADAFAVRRLGGGYGLVTKFFDLEWLRFAFETELDGWIQPSQGYPYPIPAGMEIPGKWPVADSPARPEQEDRAWESTTETSTRAATLDFLNSDFSDVFLMEGVPGQGTVPAVPDAGIDSQTVSGIAAQLRYYVDYEAGQVVGWRTRPVYGNTGNSQHYDTEKTLLEFQEPINNSSYGTNNWHGWNGFMYTDYRGRFKVPPQVNQAPFYRYAELNAALPGTLYQVSATTPGAQYMYSFYHTSSLLNLTGINAQGQATWGSKHITTQTDKMNFYLSGIPAGAIQASDDNLTLIRPCWSPRIRGRNTTTANLLGNSQHADWNSSAKNTVRYNKSEVYVNGSDLSYYRAQFDDFPADNKPFLYDVWISDLDYGITFWSESAVNNIPEDGVTSSDAIYTGNKSHIIGYWGVSFGWKHYYGLYTVPAGQVNTEFAYQSRTNTPNLGNYLSGVSFKSPAFLSVDLYARDKDDAEVSFVTIGDTVTFEMNIKNWGEIPANKIVVENQISPFNAYVEFVENSVLIDGAAPSGDVTVTLPNEEDNDYTLKMEFLGSFILEKDETIKITFQVKVRDTVIDGRVDSGVETLLYYFKDQAEVSYYDYSNSNPDTDNYFPAEAFSGVPMKPKTNASEVAQVHIDPIKLEKTAVIKSGGAPIDDPFDIELNVFNTLSGGGDIETHGIITDIIPKDFEITAFDFPDGTSHSEVMNADGSTRLTIHDVRLGGDNSNSVTYRYTLEYKGAGYGVMYTGVSADYKYLYTSESTGAEPLSVMLTFPQPVVGISVKTGSDSYDVSGTEPLSLNITGNDKFSRRFYDANYSVMPEVVLTDSIGNTADKNTAGNYFVDTDLYTAELLSGSNFLRFTPKETNGVVLPGVYTVYYRINLTAIKEGSASFSLSSRITPVTITVAGNDTFAYNELYQASSAASDTGTVPQKMDMQIESAVRGADSVPVKPILSNLPEPSAEPEPSVGPEPSEQEELTDGEEQPEDAEPSAEPESPAAKDTSASRGGSSDPMTLPARPEPSDTTEYGDESDNSAETTDYITPLIELAERLLVAAGLISAVSLKKRGRKR